jgi:hypothetical protein
MSRDKERKGLEMGKASQYYDEPEHASLTGCKQSRQRLIRLDCETQQCATESRKKINMESEFLMSSQICFSFQLKKFVLI